MKYQTYRLSFLVIFFAIGAKTTKVAITIDDFPLLRGSLFSPQERIQRFIETGKKTQTVFAFFCVGDQNKEQAHQECLAYANEAGHFLANHSMTHPFTSGLSTEVFQNEVTGVDSLLDSYKMKRKWFRFPYLDYGSLESKGGSPEKAKRAHKALTDLGYIDGYVSLFTRDYIVESILQTALESGTSVNYERLKLAYCDLIRDWCEHYAAEWRTRFNAPRVHTLLLHANDINALFLSDIITTIRMLGWEIVSPEEAFCSPPKISFSESHLKQAGCFDRTKIMELLVSKDVFKS